MYQVCIMEKEDIKCHPPSRGGRRTLVYGILQWSTIREKNQCAKAIIELI